MAAVTSTPPKRAGCVALLSTPYTVYVAHFAGIPAGRSPIKPSAIMKTNKSYTKRIKVTKNGKLVARRPGQNHFNARETGQQRLARKRTQVLNLSKRTTRRVLPRTGA